MCHQQQPNAPHHRSHSPTGESRACIVSSIQMHLITEATHFLESQGYALSAMSKCRSPLKSLTFCKAMDRSHQQHPNAAHHRSHSQAEEPSTGVISSTQMQLKTEATDQLKSQEHAFSATSKYTSPLKPLTSCRTENRCHKESPNAPHYQSHSLPGEPLTGVISSIKVHLTTKATHFLESQEQALSVAS